MAVNESFYGRGAKYGAAKYRAGYPDTNDLLVLIGGVDVTALVKAEGYAINIENVLTRQVDTCSLSMINIGYVDINEWDEIEIWNKSDKIFGGVVSITDESATAGGTRIDDAIRGTDYAALLDRVVVKKQYTTPTADADMLFYLFGTYLPEINASTYVGSIQTYPKIQFNRMTLRQVVDQLASSSNADWYIDEYKNLHFFEADNIVTPYAISDNPDMVNSFPFSDFKVNKDGTGVINRVEVVGGSTLSPDFTFFQAQSSASNTISIPYKLNPPVGQNAIQVWRQDGGAITNLVTNPSFEVNITDYWTQSDTGHGITWTWLANTDLYAGTHCLDIGAGTLSCYAYGTNITLTVGSWISISGWAKTSGLGTAMISLWDVTNNLNLASYSNKTMNSWERLVTSFQNTTNASLTVRVHLYNLASDSTTHVYWDCVQVESAAWASDYADGSRGVGYAWTGTANNSTSTRTNISILTALTVKTGYTDTLTIQNEVLFFYNEAKLHQLFNFPILTNSVKLTGRDSIPTRVREVDYASFLFYGRYFDSVLNDPSIIDRDTAVIRARGILASQSMGKVAIKCRVVQPGLRAGMLLKVTNALYGYVGETFSIQRVSHKISTGGYAYYDLDLGVYRPQFIDLFMKLARAARTVPEWIDGEVLDEVLLFQETVTCSEVSTAVTGTNAPYLWDAQPWDFSVWS